MVILPPPPTMAKVAETATRARVNVLSTTVFFSLSTVPHIFGDANLHQC